MFRKLKASEIDVRVATVKENGVSLLLFKDARVDQNILDETFGVFGWQRSHQLLGDRLYCTVSVYNEKTGEWISKQDVGTESYTEKEKGQASDSFKRACFNLGIGRELYTAPFIWISTPDVEIKTSGKPTTYDRFSVDLIDYDHNGNICALVISNTKKKKEVFKMGDIVKAKKNMIMRELERTGFSEQKLLEAYNVKSLDEMDDAKLDSAITRLLKTPSKEKEWKE